MASFIKQYPEVLIIYSSFITTVFTGLVGYYLRSALESFKESLKELHKNVTEHEIRITKLECATKWEETTKRVL